MRNHLLAAMLLAACTDAAFSAPSAGTQFDEPSVQKVANAIESAARANDSDEANSYFAADCVFHATYPNPDGGTHVTTMNLQQFLDDQAKVRREGKNEVYKSTTPVVAVQDGKATATFRATDSQIDHGKSVTTVSDQVETFGMRGSRLLVTAVDATVVSLIVDGKQLY
jgi:hypothetical protein